MEDLGQIISTNLIFLRKNAGLTQLEFGEKFNYTDKTVSRWENGSIIPSVEILKQIADFYWSICSCNLAMSFISCADS